MWVPVLSSQTRHAPRPRLPGGVRQRPRPGGPRLTQVSHRVGHHGLTQGTRADVRLSSWHPEGGGLQLNSPADLIIELDF